MRSRLMIVLLLGVFLFGFAGAGQAFNILTPFQHLRHHRQLQQDVEHLQAQVDVLNEQVAGLVDLSCILAVKQGILPPESAGCPKVAFVTSAAYQGNLIQAIPGFAGGPDFDSGIEGADARCQVLADAAGLAGEYKAWISDGVYAPATHWTVPPPGDPGYMRVDGQLIADSWADLTDGELNVPISVDEKGAQLIQNPTITDEVWTNVQGDGTPRSTFDVSCCLEWTVTVVTPVNSAAPTGDWSETMAPFWSDGAFGLTFCDELNHLYCFQQ